jgi:predicted amidophosphoribosyltransferase
MPNGRHEMGGSDICICPKCNEEKPHTRGTPCKDERCPTCGAKMVRKGGYHHQLIKERKNR